MAGDAIGAAGGDARASRIAFHAVIAGVARSCGDGSHRRDEFGETWPWPLTLPVTVSEMDDTRSVSPGLRIFFWSRAAIWVVAVISVVFFERASDPGGEWDAPRLHELGTVIDVWARWDSNWFLKIAEDLLAIFGGQQGGNDRAKVHWSPSISRWRRRACI